MRYCGIALGPGLAQLCAIGEVRADEPPIRMSALFYEPGTPEAVAHEVAAFPDAVVAIAARPTGRERACDVELRRRGVPPAPSSDAAGALFAALSPRGVYRPPAAGATAGTVEEGAYARAPIVETNPDGVFCALHGARVPARRHPSGVRLRVEALDAQHLFDDGGEFWHRRIEEIDAAAAAVCAHRYAVGHACWVGDPAEGAVVLPGATLPERFESRGVLPPVERVPLGGG